MNPEVRIDPDQMCIKSGVVRLGERNPVLYHGLAELLVLVLDNVSCVQEYRLTQTGQRTAATVRGNYGFAERGLV